MKTSVLFSTVLAALPVAQSSPIDDIIVQTMRLSEAPNYSWITTTSDDTANYTLEGRTETAGATWLRIPSPPALAAALDLPDAPYLEALYTSRSTFLLRSAYGWISNDEVVWGDPPPTIDPFALARGHPGGRMGTLGAPLPSRPAGRSSGGADRTVRLPGDIHLGLTPPHEELGIIVSSFTELQVQPDFAAGTLSDLGAALLLLRDGQTDTALHSAGGTFRLWFKDGRLIRYQLRLGGVVAQGRKTTQRRILATTIIKDVGTTRLGVPEMARLKLVP